MGFLAVTFIILSLFKEFWVLLNIGKYLRYIELCRGCKNKTTEDKTEEEKEAQTMFAWLALLAIPTLIVLVTLLFQEQLRDAAAAVFMLTFLSAGAFSLLPKLVKPAYYMFDAAATVALYVWLLHTALFI